MKNKKLCKDLVVEDIGLPGNSKLFICDSLCPYYKFLFGLCAKLRKAYLIDSCWSHKGEVFYKVHKDDKSGIRVKHEDELYEAFPEYFDEKQ